MTTFVLYRHKHDTQEVLMTTKENQKAFEAYVFNGKRNPHSQRALETYDIEEVKESLGINFYKAYHGVAAMSYGISEIIFHIDSTKVK